MTEGIDLAKRWPESCWIDAARAVAVSAEFPDTRQAELVDEGRLSSHDRFDGFDDFVADA
jgi:hypothetical protein